MDLKEKVMNLLKPKTKAFGFTKKELESVAAKIADNLNLADDADDDAINEAISNGIESVIPFLQLSQSAANRTIQAFKDSTKKSKKEEDDDVAEEDDDAPKKKSKEETTPEWAKSLQTAFQSLTAEVATLKNEKKTDGRRAKLEKLLDKTGVFGERTLKNFSRLKFDSEDEFEEYLNDVKSDLEALNQERANAGLAKLGAPQADTKKEKTDTTPMSEADINALVESFH